MTIGGRKAPDLLYWVSPNPPPYPLDFHSEQLQTRYRKTDSWPVNLFKHLKRLTIVGVRDRILVRRSLRDFYNVLGGHIYFELLYTAVELDLFTVLKENRRLTLTAISQRLGLDEFPCRILLLGLVTTGIIRKRGPYFSNTYLGNLALSRDSSLYVGNCVRWQHHIVYKPMFHLLESLKQNRNVGLEEISGPGTTLYERIASHPELETIFQNAMEEISVQANAVLAEYLDLREGESLVDIGGGKGANVLALARQNPRLRAAVFDLPTVCAIAEKNFAQASMQDRLSAIPGNCFEDPFPPSRDCFLFCHFMCIWSRDENIGLLKKAYTALNSGGRAVIFDIMQNDDERGPLAAAMGSPYFLGLATGRGMIYTIREYEDFCRHAGFRKVIRRYLPGEHTAVIAFKP